MDVPHANHARLRAWFDVSESGPFPFVLLPSGKSSHTSMCGVHGFAMNPDSRNPKNPGTDFSGLRCGSNAERVASHVLGSGSLRHHVVLDADATELAEVINLGPVHEAVVVAGFELRQQRVDEVEARFDGDHVTLLQHAGGTQEGMAFGAGDDAAGGTGLQARD